MSAMIRVDRLCKGFTLHNQGGVSYQVLQNISFEVGRGECVVLDGPSGSGKSSLLRSLYANYKPESGRVWVNHLGTEVDLVTALPRDVIAIRKHTIGYVSQFLRVIPRVSTLDVVMEPARRLGVSGEKSQARAEQLLRQLNIPERLWSLAPSTFSGGEQQRVNIARGFIVDYPILLLDEPTASLDAGNREVVVQLIQGARERGSAVVGIFHDADVRNQVADRAIPLVARQTQPSAEEIQA